jgi:hypothetical protein
MSVTLLRRERARTVTVADCANEFTVSYMLHFSDYLLSSYEIESWVHSILVIDCVIDA